VEPRFKLLKDTVWVVELVVPDATAWLEELRTSQEYPLAFSIGSQVAVNEAEVSPKFSEATMGLPKDPILGHSKV
jgi:hypothetical protein